MFMRKIPRSKIRFCKEDCRGAKGLAASKGKMRYTVRMLASGTARVDRFSGMMMPLFSFYSLKIMTWCILSTVTLSMQAFMMLRPVFLMVSLPAVTMRV